VMEGKEERRGRGTSDWDSARAFAAVSNKTNPSFAGGGRSVAARLGAFYCFCFVRHDFATL
jgi:hypothetical protein